MIVFLRKFNRDCLPRVKQAIRLDPFGVEGG